MASAGSGMMLLLRRVSVTDDPYRDEFLRSVSPVIPLHPRTLWRRLAKQFNSKVTAAPLESQPTGPRVATA